MSERIAVAMSGGVDSSVAASLLVGQGFEVVGVTQKLWCYAESEPGSVKACCSIEAIDSARRVCSFLGIRHYVLDFEDEFRRHVLRPFLKSYVDGLTPNPCVWCNSRLRFGSLLRKMERVGCGLLATGHYCRIMEEGGERFIRRGADESKDQSYFLWAVEPEVLPKILFPLGEMRKSEVRAVAGEIGLPAAERPESQDLCFGGGEGPPVVLRELAGEEGMDPDGKGFRPGPVVHSSGEVLGEHRGTAGFTIGQRRNLGLSFPKPLYVTRVHPERDTIYVGGREELFRRVFTASETNWFGASGIPKTGVTVKTRYRKTDAPCSVEEQPRGIRVTLRYPQEALTPGQSAVFYRGEKLLGGGVIDRD